MGLAVCHQLVQLNGGRIWVDSELGRGSTFTLLIIEGSRIEGISN
ncbi:ATP-binding protein [Chloroflexota bacterium]